MTVIPNPPSLGDTFLNEVTGVTYQYDGTKWVIISTPGSDGQQQISDDLLALTSRVSDGEGVQEQIQETISNALDTQSNIQETVSNALDTQSNIQGNIIELEEEIESLAPSLDRGKWNLATLGTGVTLAAGEYAMGIGVDSVYCQEKYLECVANANNDPFLMSECTRLAGECENAKDNGNEYYINDWSHATFLHFYKTDSEGKDHTFSDYEVGMFIDLFDQGDSGFAVFEITAAPELNGDVYTIGVTPIQHEGEASGLARIKVFELAGIDPTEFVRKTGDTMTGTLNVDVGNSTALFVRSNLTSSNSIFYVRNGDNTTQFRVTADGKVQAGNQATTAFMATDPHDVITKKYADQYCRVPTAYQYELKYMETPTDAKAMELARVPGQWAKTNNGIWINRYDKNELVDLSPYFTSNQGSFTTPGDVEEDIEGEVSTFGDTLVLDYQGLYDNMRGFLSVYQKYNRERLGLRRMYAIPSVTWYKNEPFIKLTWSKNFNLDSLYFSECFLSLPGII